MSKASKSKNTRDESPGKTPRKFEVNGGQDLPDNPHDEERMKPETGIIDLPDISDIPGQEDIVPPPLGELSDDTASSDDEEGTGLFEDEQNGETKLAMGNEGDVSKEEKRDLQLTDEDMPTKDEQNLRQSSLDSTDEEGDDLNEQGFGKNMSGSDLDVPGTEADDEEIGEEDEENNPYSMPDNDAGERTQ